MLPDYGLVGCHCCQPVQRTQYECVDVVGVLRRIHRDYPSPSLHGELFFLFNRLVSRIESESKNYRQSTMRSRLDGSSPQSGGIIISYGLLRTSGSAYLLPSVSRWHPATSPKHGSLDLPQMTSTSCGTSPKWNPTAMWFVMLNWAVHSRAWRLRLPYHVRIVLPLRRMSGLLWTSAMRAGRICRLGRELLIGALISRLRSRAWPCGAYRLICRNDGRAVGISHYRTNQRIVSWAMCSVCGKPFCGGNFPMNEVFEIFFFSPSIDGRHTDILSSIFVFPLHLYSHAICIHYHTPSLLYLHDRLRLIHMSSIGYFVQIIVIAELFRNVCRRIS